MLLGDHLCWQEEEGSSARAVLTSIGPEEPVQQELIFPFLSTPSFHPKCPSFKLTRWMCATFNMTLWFSPSFRALSHTSNFTFAGSSASFYSPRCNTKPHICGRELALWLTWEADFCDRGLVHCRRLSATTKTSQGSWRGTDDCIIYQWYSEIQ